jgi:hypothetical protein
VARRCTSGLDAILQGFLDSSAAIAAANYTRGNGTLSPLPAPLAGLANVSAAVAAGLNASALAYSGAMRRDLDAFTAGISAAFAVAVVLLVAGALLFRPILARLSRETVRVKTLLDMVPEDDAEHLVAALGGGRSGASSA